MACPLSAILNPVDRPAQRESMPAIDDDSDDDDNATISGPPPEIFDEMPDAETADQEMLGFNKPSKHRQDPPDSESGTGISVNRVPVLPRTADDPSPSETNSKIFSIFNALLKHPELTLEFTKQLDIEDLISLYAISKDFHILVNCRFTAMILGQSNSKAAESSRIFIFRCYKSLCMRDPARRLNETKPDELRFIPSFRWLRMVFFREAVVDDILRSLAEEGHRVPKRTRLTIKKIWFTIDLSDNARRIGLVHNTTFWSNQDLFLATMFFIKLDMRLTHPTAGNGEIGLRKMLLAQRSLSTLAKVLRREEMRTQVDMLRMIVRFNYEPPRHRQMDIMGVPSQEIGRLQYEGWGAKSTKFIQIDELVMREAVKRKLNLQNYYIDMMIYGYINKTTFQDIRTPMDKQENGAESDTSSDDDEETSQGDLELDMDGEEARGSSDDVEMD